MCLNGRYMEHMAQGDLIALRAFEDNSAGTNLFDCGFISKTNSAINSGVILEVSSAGCDVVSCTTVHHPMGLCIGSIQGNREIIIDLLNRGSGWYKYMCISCLAAGAPILLLFVTGLILLLFLAVRLYMAHFVTIVAGEIGMISFFFLAICFNGGTSHVKSCQGTGAPSFLIKDASDNLAMLKQGWGSQGKDGGGHYLVRRG